MNMIAIAVATSFDTVPRKPGNTLNPNAIGIKQTTTGSAKCANVNSIINNRPNSSAASTVTKIKSPEPGLNIAAAIPKTDHPRFPNARFTQAMITSKKFCVASAIKLSPRASAPRCANTTRAGMIIAKGTNTIVDTPAPRSNWMPFAREPSADFAVTNSKQNNKMINPAPNATL
ncbi:MAG: hypothetical protein LBK54_06730 [Propionibacteriaceae bacterium]|nr:hypothetical protein [Propionibacteriaceae bacterium]